MPLNPRLSDWRGRKVWIIGASSGIGLATARALHRAGARVAVSARDGEALQRFVADHPGSLALPLDVTASADIRDRAAQLLAAWGTVDLAMYCAGHYQAQRATAFDLGQMQRHNQVNYLGALDMLAALVPAMLLAGAGHLSLVGSVAGYRGLPQSLAYGPTKAALNNLAEVLYLDLHDRRIGVSIINPGFVATALTAANDFAMPALIGADEAANRILSGWSRGDFEIHFPRRFTWFLKLLSLLPHRLYFSLIRRLTGL
jgi:NAD(P)-dependent dehydrogenase (short-subunit alcohol dehydrogenase family)